MTSFNRNQGHRNTGRNSNGHLTPSMAQRKLRGRLSCKQASKSMFEALEERQMFSLLGVAPVGYPQIGFAGNGAMAYHQSTGQFDVACGTVNFELTSASV